jgi:uncharacterized protein
MNDERFGSNFFAAAVLAAGLVLAAIIFGYAFVQARQGDQTITVTGSARKRIKSDLVIWKAGVSYQSAILADAYRSLSENVPRVKAYLVGKGIPENQITISSISSQTLHARDSDGQDTGQITGYSLRQELEVRSTDVDLISRVAREATELINQGILLESSAPEYHYTKLGEEKITMLAEAAKDAKKRAEQVAASTDSSIGNVRTARMGVLQITPADSNEVSDSGMNDTSSLDKDITAVVNLSFEIK